MVIAGRPLRRVVTWLAAAGGGVAGVYAACAASVWVRYGTPSPPHAADADERLDRFMPRYDVVERHHIRVQAPAAVTLAAAKEMALLDIPAIRAIFRSRELLLGAAAVEPKRPRGIVEETRALGWVVLDEVPDREIIMGAVTKPWEADVTFRSIPPEQFAAFAVPEYVKIVWNLRADPLSSTSSTFRTETRAVATDATARARFRRYWAFLSPGISLIRWLSLRPLKADAEARARAAILVDADASRE
jgi:hypothetical protein